MSVKNIIKPWLISGLLLGLSFPLVPDLPNGVLAWFAFVPFLLSTEKIQNIRSFTLQSLGFILAFIFSATWWVGYYNVLYMIIGVFIIAPFYLVSLSSFYLIKTKFGWHKALLLFPFLWTLNDWLIHVIPHGMQVHLTPYSQANNSWLTQFIDLTGMFGLSFWIAMMNVALLFWIKNKTFKTALFPIFWLVLPLYYSLWVIQINPKGTLGLNNASTKVSIIQTNKDSYAEKDSLYLQNVLNEIVSLCDSAVRTSEPDLLVLPEAAVPLNLLQNTDLLALTRQLINSWQTSIAIGFQNNPDSTKPYEFENDAMIFTPQLAMMWDSLQLKPNDIKVYQKEYGLPFVEITPFFNNVPTVLNQKLISNKEIYTFQYQNFDNQQFRAALSICWEQLFPEKIAALVDDGAQFVALMNNDAWFGKTPGARQLRAITRLRAIENRRTIVRSSNGGISCFIDPFGRIYGEIPWFTSTISTKEVLCVKKKSFYTKYPNFFIKSCLLAFVGLIVFFAVRPRF